MKTSSDINDCQDDYLYDYQPDSTINNLDDNPSKSQQHTQAEIAKFDSLAHDFWNTNSAFKALHQINPLRCQFIKNSVDLKNKKALDIGCGGGILSESLYKMGANVCAIDLSAKGIEIARNHQKYSKTEVDYQVISSADMLKNYSAQFDVVCCMEMLEHVDNPQTILDDCAKLTQPNGWVFVSTINRTLKANLLAIFLAENIGMVPKGTHDYRHFIKPSELINMAKRCDLQVKAISGIEFRPLHQDFIITNNVDINYMLAFQKRG